ncbi:bifunctional protein-serine/threonine kinase/phosphatase [Sulfurimonas sp. C5]|uniref:bifunctional protein-serine/threonine kinase/phosphatase n=1 Tax=Sulfurimonas sp. C5 TaxID=3036947 RepID=UPI002456633C|nr:bifunctional protein-serine/threonine kinase/phosphatase [Sulfurimonas sp. C5]MDH4944169.1 protein kinase [Sulfurimonas sp. C5]
MVPNIQSSGFSLAKRDNLTGDDFYEVQSIGDLTIAVVCDGVGSAAEGAEAAKRTTSYLINNFKNRPKSWSIEKSMKSFIKSINNILYKESIVNYEREELVTTLAIVVLEGNRLYGANIGDTRIYLYRDQHLIQISVDHSMNESGYEGVLTQAIGITENVEPYYFENVVQNSDKILLCSDGLYNVLSKNIIEKNIISGAYTLVKKASNLMNENLPDDTTAVVLNVNRINELLELKSQKLEIPISLKKGEVIDGYRLEKSLIQNNRTWLANKDGKEYVLKFAPAEAIDDEEILDLFVKEVWNANRLIITSFPTVLIPQNRTYRYYVMEYCSGVDLKTYLEQKQLNTDDTIHLAKTLLQLSQYLLKYDLVHGDIKPENIIVNFIEDRKEFKIVDFGSITELFSIQSRAGTPSFLAPERFLGDSINESTEIFAIGVTLYRALTKHYPYGEIEPFSNPWFKEAKKPSLYNKNIPSWLDSIILKSIAIEPDRRYKHYSEMMYELETPQNVKPYFSKSSSLIERSPVLFYRTAFTIMFLINICLFIFLLEK